MSEPKAVELKRDVNEEVVEFLERLVEQAKDGEIHAIAAAAAATHRIVYTGWCGGMPLFELIGAIESLKIEILVRKDQALRERIWELIHEEAP